MHGAALEKTVSPPRIFHKHRALVRTKAKGSLQKAAVGPPEETEPARRSTSPSGGRICLFFKSRKLHGRTSPKRRAAHRFSPVPAPKRRTMTEGLPHFSSPGSSAATRFYYNHRRVDLFLSEGKCCASLRSDSACRGAYVFLRGRRV